MKGVDALGPMLEPTPQATEGTPAKTKDGKPFDALLAEAVEQDPGKGAKQSLKGEAKLDPKAPLDAKGALELPVVPRSIHSAIQAPENTSEGLLLEVSEDAPLEQPRALEEPRSPQQDQLVLAQIATVVARIVAPAKEPVPSAAKPEPTKTAAISAATTRAALPAPPPANDVAPPGRAQEFHDALSAFDLTPHDAQTLRPGASDSVPPSAELPRGPIGRALQALTGENAPIRAAADKVMTAFRALSARDAAPSVPAPAPSGTPTLVPGAEPPVLIKNAPAMPPPAPTPNPLPGTPLASQAFARAPSAAEMPTLRPGAQPTLPPAQGTTLPATPSAPLQGPAIATQPAQEKPPVQVSFEVPAPQPDAPQVPSARDAVAPKANVIPQPGQPVRPQPQPAQTFAPTQPPLPPVEAAPAQPQATPTEPQVAATQPQAAPTPLLPGQGVPTIVPQPANVQPAIAEVQQAVSEEAAREQPSEKIESEPRDRVHGFSRGGWSGPAMSAYGGRGHEGGERGDRGDRGESARTLQREEERVAERVGEEAAPQFTVEPFAPLQEPPQFVQSTQQAQETRQQNVPQNQPAPAVPVQELPDIVFQGRPDPTAATENASISLHHPDLGPIQLEVHREQGRVEVHAVIESQHAQAVLRANESGIRQGVQQAGMTFNALRVRVRGEEQPTNRPGQERRRRSNQRET